MRFPQSEHVHVWSAISKLSHSTFAPDIMRAWLCTVDHRDERAATQQEGHAGRSVKQEMMRKQAHVNTWPPIICNV